MVDWCYRASGMVLAPAQTCIIRESMKYELVGVAGRNTQDNTNLFHQ